MASCSQRALRLRGGGGDGGTKPLTHAQLKWMYSSNLSAKDQKDDRKTIRQQRANLCAASQNPLSPPLAVTDLGFLCNKLDLIQKVLDKTLPTHLNHVKSMKNIHQATLEPNPCFKQNANDPKEVVEHPFMCPVTKLPFNGKIPFIYLRPSGLIVSERALKLVGGSICPVTEVSCTHDDLVPVYGSEEQVESLRLKLEARKCAALGKKAAAKFADSSSTEAHLQNPACESTPSGEFESQTSVVDVEKSRHKKINVKNRGESAAASSKRRREWDDAIEEKAAKSEIYKSIFVSQEQKAKDLAEGNKNFVARGIPMSLSRATKFTM